MEVSSKILINGITFDRAILAPLLLNIRYWQIHSCKITFLGTSLLEKKIKKARIIKDFEFIILKEKKGLGDKLSLIIEGLRRNLVAIFYIKRIKNNYDVIYSRSSVLDLVIFPYFLKIFDKKIKWMTIFDNTVPFTDSGNKLIRFLAWGFFQMSLFFLKRADRIFVISETLANYLVRKGFDKEKIILTGNAVELDLIKKARRDDRYNIDALFVGRINEAKGIYDMLSVLEILKKKYSNFQLVIMGDGDIKVEERYKKEIKKRGLGSNIKFLGSKTGLEKFNIIKSSRTFLFLSKSESFGIALLEAVCCGVKAFVYDLSAYKDIYKNNEILIFKKNDFYSVADAMIKTFDNKNFGNLQGELLSNKYGWDRIAKIEFDNFQK